MVPLPKLALQGVILDGSNLSAVINRRVVHLGEWIDGVQLVRIDAESVCVEWEGQTNWLHLAR